MKNFKFQLLANLEDGTPVSFEGDFIVGTAVFTIDTNGEKAPATDGDYTLEDGTKFTVKGGLIDSIPTETPADEPAPVEQATEPAPAEGEPKPDLEKQIADLTQMVNDLKAEVEKLKEGQTKMTEDKQLMESNINEKFSALNLQSATSKEPKTITEKSFGELVFEKINHLKVK